MYCPTCGARNGDSVRFCGNCGKNLEAQEPSAPDPQPYDPPPPEPQPYRSYRFEAESGFEPQEQPLHINNYLIPSILVTLFCCLPLGIAAIIFAAQVNGKVASGDIPGAQSASRTARTLVIVSVVLGVTIIAIGVLVGLLGEPPPELTNG